MESQSLALLRESLVGTLATIYSVGSTGNEDTIKNKMAASQSNYEEGVQLRIRDHYCCSMLLPCNVPVRSITRKPTLEMAARATYLDECVCIHSSAHCVSDSKVISPQQFFALINKC
jgi:hypothetical protein